MASKKRSSRGKRSAFGITTVALVYELANIPKKSERWLSEKLALDNGKWYPGKRVLRLLRGGGRAIRDGLYLPGQKIGAKFLHGASGSSHKKRRK